MLYNLLGRITNEIKTKDGNFIQELISAGLKNDKTSLIVEKLFVI